MKVTVKTYPTSGDFQHAYSPLQNMMDKNGDIKGFNSNLNLDLNHPVNIECEPSYDGTVNLILNDDKNPPRIVNSRFTKIENNQFKVINRNQNKKTNIYSSDRINDDIKLFKPILTFPKIDLIDVPRSGQLKGGTYIFYARYEDEDYNKSSVISESGPIAVFKGSSIDSISGALQDEITDKSIIININNLDSNYNKLYLSYVRYTSDDNGIKLIKAYNITKPYDITSDSETIIISGVEEEAETTVEEFNINYNVVDSVKTSAQVQNMLFFGNVTKQTPNNKELQNISYYIKVTLKQKENSIGWTKLEDYKSNGLDEYYDPINIYYNVGYWPDEIYRLGIVYILNNGTLSPVYSLRGCKFNGLDENNLGDGKYDENKYLENNAFLNGTLTNTFGVFKNPDISVIDYAASTVKPLYYNIDITDVKAHLKKLGVKGYFIVRQKRTAYTLGQGLSVGIDQQSHIPMLYDGKYFSESFIDKNKKLVYDFSARKVESTNIYGYGIICPEVDMIPDSKSCLDGSEVILKSQSVFKLKQAERSRYFYTDESESPIKKSYSTKAIYIPEDTPLKYVGGYSFSSKCGSSEDVGQFSFLESRNDDKDYTKLIRGNFCSYIGICGEVQPSTIYSIKYPGYNERNTEQYFLNTKANKSEFFACSNRISIDEDSTLDIFRGDCYTATVTVRINRNFVDSETPVAELIIDQSTWADNYKGYNNMVKNYDYSVKGEKLDSNKGDFADINRADINTVPLGMWVTFKCLSNYNLGLRSIDSFHVDEYNLMGNPRQFYPISDITVNASHKIPESKLLNQGYSTTLGQQRNYLYETVPYTKDLFDNRIMFSDVQTYGNFQNSYAVFKSLDYQDIDRQYGAIVKLLPWNNNLLCVFEHGIGIIPVNEKALLSTTTGQSVHMYGAGVLQNQITVVSPDFGSIWQDSIIRTPIGVYGIDTTAKKIWRVTQQGIEMISDMKIQQYLNIHIKLDEMNKYTTLTELNVKTHYNAFKGDVMFTFYNSSKKECWNICFNERLNMWVSRYDWTPLLSENIDNIFYSFGLKPENKDVNKDKYCLYVHGKAGTFDEMDYNDDNPNNQILPCKWYGEQKKFELEFVVNAETGLHKIFDNLVIISNKVKPEELQFTITGDVYHLNKAELYKEKGLKDNSYTEDSEIGRYSHTGIQNANIEWDTTLNTYYLKVDQKCKDIETAGRRIGNIQYKEDSWYTNIEPIILKDTTKSARIRDKWCKVRVIYSGNDLVIITALKTLYTQSYA